MSKQDEHAGIDWNAMESSDDSEGSESENESQGSHEGNHDEEQKIEKQYEDMRSQQQFSNNQFGGKKRAYTAFSNPNPNGNY